MIKLKSQIIMPYLDFLHDFLHLKIKMAKIITRMLKSKQNKTFSEFF